jgi:solanesyl diphosphate synthase
MRALLRTSTSLFPRLPTTSGRSFTNISSSVVDKVVRSAALQSIHDDEQFAESSDLDRAFLDRAVRLCRLAGTAEGVGQVVPMVSGEEHVRDVNPFDLVSSDMRKLNGQIKELLGSDHPVLETVAQYFFDVEGGKKIRPTMVLLMSRACNEDALASGMLSNVDGAGELPFSDPAPSIKQVRLAEITEMIHTASLLHDDVIDTADSRRGVESVNSMFGNKLAVLAGDFLLARSSVCMARLRNLDVIEILATVIEHLVKGEVIQMKGVKPGSADTQIFDTYLRKNYYKTGSLMANSCKAACLLNHHKDHVRVSEAAFIYGRGVGAAFQLVDDVLDFEASQAELGKPILNDLRQGLATAPVLFAQQQHPGLSEMMHRKFDAPGDVERAHEMVLSSDGLQRTKELAIEYSNQAVEAILTLEQSDSRDALVRLARQITTRKM